MNVKQLKNSILQWAIQGKLVEQNPKDEPASILLERIAASRNEGENAKKKKTDFSHIYREGASWYEEIGPSELNDISGDVLFDIPESWVWCRLSNIVDVKGGKRIPAGRTLTDKDTGHKYIRVADMKNGTVNLGNIKYVPEDIYEVIKRYTISKDDVYITVAGTIGDVGTIPEELDGANLTENADKLILYGGVDKSFLCLMMSSYVVKNQIAEATTKVGQPKLAISRIEQFIVPLPPLAEQKRIVAKIEELMPLVEEYGKAQSSLDALNANLPTALKKSILQEAIQGRLVPQIKKEGPASALLDQIQKAKEKLVQEGKLKKKDLQMSEISDDEKPFDIPETWEWVRFEDLAFRITGKTPERGNATFWQNAEYPWVSISDMTDYGHVCATKEKISAKASKLMRNISPKGSLLMSFKLTVGRTSILDIDAYHNEAIITILPYFDRDNIFRDYLFTFLPLITQTGDSKDAIKGQTLNAKSIAALKIPVPPLEEQKRIVSKIEELFQQIEPLKN